MKSLTDPTQQTSAETTFYEAAENPLPDGPTPLYMVFDVESIGLHGEGFSFGYTVINAFGVEIAKGIVGCPRDRASGATPDREWVDANIPEIVSEVPCTTPLQVRNVFWSEYQGWKKLGAILCAECLWPVEANFVSACIRDDASRIFEGPYPFHEISSVMSAAGMNPMETYPRLKSELPKHNPLADARQSARLLVMAMNRVTIKP